MPSMKKVLLAEDVKDFCTEQNSFLARSDITVFTASSNDDILNIHKREKLDLIVSKLDMPGLSSEELFQIIKQRRDLQKVATILFCRDTPTHRARCSQCSANAVLALPVDSDQLQAAMLQLLNIAPRQSHRVALKVTVEGKFKQKPFLYRIDNISATGMLIAAEIKAEESLVQGDQLTLSFCLPAGTHLTIQGKVERIIPQSVATNVCLYGIKFAGLTPGVQSEIESFINKEQKHKHKRSITGD